MLCAEKICLIFMVAALVSEMTEAETTKRDLINQHPELELVSLGNFGPISRLFSHPAFAHLGLTSQQTIGFVNILLQNGFLNPRALRLANRHPFLGDFYGSTVLPGNFYGIPSPAIDPYIFFLFSNYARFLPYGLGPQGIYGSTGIPKPQPLRVFKHNDKN